MYIQKGLESETYTLADDRIFVRRGKENKQLTGNDLVQHVKSKAVLLEENKSSH